MILYSFSYEFFSCHNPTWVKNISEAWNRLNTTDLNKEKSKYKKIKNFQRTQVNYIFELSSCTPQHFLSRKNYFRGLFIGYTWRHKCSLWIYLSSYRRFLGCLEAATSSQKPLTHVLTSLPPKPDLCYFNLPFWPFSECSLLVPKIKIKKNSALQAPFIKHTGFSFLEKWDRKHLTSLMIWWCSDPTLHRGQFAFL